VLNMDPVITKSQTNMRKKIAHFVQQWILKEKEERDLL